MIPINYEKTSLNYITRRTFEFQLVLTQVGFTLILIKPDVIFSSLVLELCMENFNQEHKIVK